MKPPFSPHKVVFLDRDGVINRDSPAYIKTWGEFEFLPGSLDALRRLSAAGFTVIVISNQSAVNRRLMDLEALLDMHRKMRAVVSANGGYITDVFYCPHRPDEGCGCRKPQPGLILKACRKHGIDVKKVIMIGDSTKDMVCARNAGCAAAVLVKTGNGVKSLGDLSRQGLAIDFVAEDLADATDWILTAIH